MKDNPLEIFKTNRQKLKDNHVYNENMNMIIVV